MSSWTYVIGSIEVDTFKKEAVKEVRKFMEKAPKITGSERDVQVFLNEPENTNDYEEYEDEETGKMVLDRFNTRVIITLYGNLRNREIPDTEKELDKFMDALEEEFQIDLENVKVF